MEIRNTFFDGFIQEFTSNSYIMVITSDKTIRKIIFSSYLEPSNILINIQLARKHFENIVTEI